MNKLRTIDDLSGPKGLPLLGNALQLRGTSTHMVLENWAKQFGRLYKIKLGKKPIVIIADSTMVNAILKDRPDGFRRYAKFEEIFEEMNLNGVFTAEGENWNRQRKLTLKGLSNRHLRQFSHIIMDVSLRLKKQWEQDVDTEKEICVQKDLMRFLVDVTTRLVLGCEMNTLEKKNECLQDYLEQVFPKIQSRVFAPFPYWRYFKMPSDYKLDKALLAIHQQIRGYIANARTRILQHPELRDTPTNFIEALLAKKEEGGAMFSDREIAANAFTMLLAGEDTTAHSLSWIIHFMLEYPEVQNKLQEEVDAVLGEHDVLQSISQVKDFVYMEAVIHESMRLKPVAPYLLLDTVKDTEIGGLSLTAGTTIFTLSRVEALEESYFAEANKFLPERWLKTNNCEKLTNSPSFRPFGNGPRVCPGRNLAFLEIKIVLAMICKNFQLSKQKNAERVEEKLAFTMYPENLKVHFSRRDSKVVTKLPV